jgi:hypothetical protein
MFVKPNNGLSVRCPVKGIPLPKEVLKYLTIFSGVAV